MLSGVYVDGPLDALIVVAYAVTGAVLASIGAILVIRVSHDSIGWILGALAAWLATTFLLIMSGVSLTTGRESLEHGPEAV